VRRKLPELMSVCATRQCSVGPTSTFLPASCTFQTSLTALFVRLLNRLNHTRRKKYFHWKHREYYVTYSTINIENLSDLNLMLIFIPHSCLFRKLNIINKKRIKNKSSKLWFSFMASASVTNLSNDGYSRFDGGVNKNKPTLQQEGKNCKFLPCYQTL